MNLKSIAAFLLFYLCLCLQTWAQQPLKVGAVLALSGTAGITGRELRQGMELCLSNAAQLIFEDSQGQPALGLSAFRKLVESDKIVLGVVSFSGVASSILPVAASYRVPVILTIVSSRSVTHGTKGDAFRFFTSGEQEAPIMARYLSLTRGLRNAAVLSLEDEYGISYRDAFISEFAGQGGSVVIKQEFSRDSLDYRSVFARIKASGAEVVYIVGHDAHLLAAVRQARELGVSALLASNWLLASPAVRSGNESLLEGTVITSPSFYWSQEKRQADFRSLFESRFGASPSAYAALGCDISTLLDRYGRQGIKSLVSTLRNIRDFKGIVGPVVSAPDGSLEFPLYPALLKNGQVVPLTASENR